MFRSLAKDAAAQVASWTRVDALARRTPYVVGYHRVVERLDAHAGIALPAMEITAATFEKHLDWLARHYEIVSIDELPARMNRRGKPVAAITFDDGYADVFHNAFPLLARKGIPAAFFVVTDLVGTTAVPVHDRLYAALAAARVNDAFAIAQTVLRIRKHDDVVRILDSIDAGDERNRDALQPMTWDMLAEVRDAGMTIGSHSMTHAFLTNETPARIGEELRGSRATLRARLGIAADAFAYPGGVFDAATVDAVQHAGYRIAFTDCRHGDPRHPLLTIRRRGLWEGACADRRGRFSPSIMSCHSAALFDRCSMSH